MASCGECGLPMMSNAVGWDYCPVCGFESIMPQCEPQTVYPSFGAKTFGAPPVRPAIPPPPPTPEFGAAEKPSNPKDIVGSNKLPLHLWPVTATALACLANLNGCLKYGRSNWREVGVRASIYVDAAQRHLNAWFEGEENDPDDGVPHLGAALACIGILVDSLYAGNLTDDRNLAGGYRRAMTELTPHVERLKALHAERNPKHYTIADNPKPLKESK